MIVIYTLVEMPDDALSTGKKRLIPYLKKMERFLIQNYPDCILMPTLNNLCESHPKGKNPAFPHKGIPTEELWAKWRKEGRNGCDKGLVIILREGMIVIDVDDMNVADDLEQRFPDFKETAIQKTSSGKHYFFRRTPMCDFMKVFDRSRLMKDANGNVLPIDIKTKCSTGTGGVISIWPSPNKEWLIDLFKADVLKSIPSEFIEYVIDSQKNTALDNRKVDGSITVIPRKAQRPYIYSPDMRTMSKLVDMLDRRRAENYDDWIRLGWCLHNLAHDDEESKHLLSMWIDFSKSCSSKYRSGECETLWKGMRNDGYGIGSLHMWAKCDSPYDYKLLINNDNYNAILNCNCTHNAISAVASKLLKGRYVCALASGKLWYVFDGTLWKEDHECIGIRRELSTTVREQVFLTMSKYRSSFNIDDMQSTTSTDTVSSEMKQTCDRLSNIARKLEDANFKDNVTREMREHLYDDKLLDKLDSNPNLIAFTNGVWQLKEKCFRPSSPEDYVSLSVGYPYENFDQQTELELRDTVLSYFVSLHPDALQREYIMKTFARQLYGDHGNELFHMHSGHKGSASNGKTKFFEVLEECLGDYVRKFGVEFLISKQRPDPGKPMPEFRYWKSRRIMFCTEPLHTDTLNSGVIKDLTGGENIQYRLLFSNTVHTFRPQMKLHVMCNNSPAIDGSDQGVQRRIRKVDYVSWFIDEPEKVCPSKFRFLKDSSIIQAFIEKRELKLAFVKLLFDMYDHNYTFNVPPAVSESSKMYMKDNNLILQFINECIVEEEGQSFALKDAEQLMQSKFNVKVNHRCFKNEMERALGECIDQKRVMGVKKRCVFCGYKLCEDQTEIADDGDGDV